MRQIGEIPFPGKRLVRGLVVKFSTVWKRKNITKIGGVDTAAFILDYIVDKSSRRCVYTAVVWIIGVSPARPP